MALLITIGIIIGVIILIVGLTGRIVGFRTIGVAAGSCAASIQSCIGNVAKRSCFAIMTCLGMRGCFKIMIIIGIIILLIFGIYILISSDWFKYAISWINKNIIDWFKNIFS